MEIVIPALNDVWMDNGVETFYRLLKEAQNSSFSVKTDNNSLIITVADFDKFKESVGIAIKNRRSNLIVIDEDKKLGVKKEVKKDYILIQEGTKVGGKVAFKEELYNDKTAADTVKKVFDLIAEKGTNNCIVCGRQFSKPMKKLQQASYPFVTKIKSLSGVRSYKDGIVYSFKEYFDDFCPTCYLTGISEWLDDGIIYRTVPGEKSILFLPRFNNLEELGKFKQSYRPLLNKSSRYCNIRVKEGSEETENPSGSFSTLLCFYEKFFFDVDKKEVIGKSWAMMEVPFGAVKNIKLNVINLAESVLHVIKELSEDNIRIYKGILTEIFFFYDHPKGAPVDWDLTGEIRENLSKAILKDDFHSFARSLLPGKGGKVGYSKEIRKNLEDLIYIWRLKNMGVPKDKLDTIKSVGNIVAKASRKNPSLLYKLDKTRTIDDFWGVLREISRKLVGFEDSDKKMIKPTALDGIIQLVKEYEDKWKEIRDLLVIYSSMYYSIGGRKEGETNE
ncbi:MAG: hypothetical protein OIN66_14715 [Candidatus Methanoperedens sp.]|nr:hypothetical protein [Candidatus Methanoperedens sp.]